RQVAEGFRLIESGMEPVIVAQDEAAAEIVRRLRTETITPGKAARALQRHIVQVPPAWRRKLLDNGHAEFISGYDDQFVVLGNATLSTRETGLHWEAADELGDSVI